MNALTSHLQNKSHIIWDWNGTLLDDVDMVVGAISDVLAEHSRPPLTREEYTALFRFPVADYYKDLGFDFEKVPFETISERFVHFYMERILTCNLHEGVPEILDYVQKSGATQSILSAAHEESLLRHLDHYEIRGYFHHVFALSDHNAKGKLERGRELIKASGHAPEETLLIGDTDHDLEVGHALGIDVVLLGDGHQSYERLTPIHHKVIESRRSH